MVSVYHDKWQTTHGLFLSPLKFEGFDFVSNESLFFCMKVFLLFPPLGCTKVVGKSCYYSKAIWNHMFWGLILEPGNWPGAWSYHFCNRHSWHFYDFEKTSELLTFFLRNQVEFCLWGTRKLWPGRGFLWPPVLRTGSRTRAGLSQRDQWPQL